MNTRVFQSLIRVRSFAGSRNASLMLVVATLATCLVFAVENDAEEPAAVGPVFKSANAATGEKRASKVDSGWAVATPGTIATGSARLQQQTILHHVLEQGRTPLINIRANNAVPPVSVIADDPHTDDSSDAATQSSTGVRFAVRPDGIEGWRSPGPVVTPRDDPWQPPNIQPNSEDRPAPSTEFKLRFSDSGNSEAAQTAEPQANSFTDRLGEASANAADETAEDEPFDLQEDDSAELAAESDQDITPRQAPPSAEAPPALTPQLVQLRSRVRSVLKGYYRKTLNSREHDPWEVMHGMLSYGIHSRVRSGGPRGEPITSVGWLCYNKPCKGQTLLHVTRKGELRARYGVGLQGHLGQFLAMLAQCRVSPDYPIHVGNHEYTIHDLIEAEKQTCYPNSELTFKLIALQYYLDLNDRWVNDQGQEWDIPRLIREELAQPIRGAACGGTHRLSSLSLTVNSRVRRGEPLDGEYARAAEFVQKYHQYAFRLQNRDGSLSTLWFRGRGDDSDIDRRIKTTGHILEWLCYSLSDEELREERTIRAVTYLANLMYSKYNNEWEVGPMCHAIHALLLYDERVFQPFDGESFNVVYRPNPRTARATQPNAVRR